MAQKPSIPKGTRDFGPQEMAERNYIFDTVRSVFRTYGYSQIDTPAMENLSTLMGKYGDEGDKLLLQIHKRKPVVIHKLIEHDPQRINIYSAVIFFSLIHFRPAVTQASRSRKDRHYRHHRHSALS